MFHSVAATRAATTVDLNGMWVIADSFMDKQDGTNVAMVDIIGNNGRKDVTPVKLKGAFLQRLQARQASIAAGKATEDDTAGCLPQGAPLFWIGPYAYEFVQTAKQINLYQEWMSQTRRIYLDGRPHPADLDPTYNGHSVGHWEGRTLVFDTVGLLVDTKLPWNDAPHSAKLRMSERIIPENRNLLRVEQRFEDPDALEEPFTKTIWLRRKPDLEVQEYVCAQNNRETTDEHGVARSSLQEKP